MAFVRGIHGTLLTLLLLFSGITGRSLAEVPEEPADYAPTVAAALAEFELGNMVEARSLLLKAHALFPNARTQRALGMTEFELRNYVAAIAYLEAALGSALRPLDDPLRAETERLLARARGFTGTVLLQVTPSEASVRVDAVDIDLARQRPLILSIGEHSIEVRAPGHQRETRHLKLESGESQRVNIVLERGATGREGGATGRPLRRNAWLWTGVAALLVGGAVAATVLALKPRDVSVEQANGGSSGAVLIGPMQGDAQ